MPRYLFIVAKDHPELGAHLEREFAGEDGVNVVIDRRREDRRRHQIAPDVERRRADRRSHSSIQQELTALNFALVRAD